MDWEKEMEAKNKIKSEAALREERILAFWQKENIFEKALAKDSPAGEFVFYEGPPTANGRPGIHHLEARAFKDALPRYKTMRGFHVERKAGWDTHGLPVELQVEKELGFTSKKDIEDYGIALYNKKCKESVWLYKNEWEEFTDRLGFWLDKKNPYITYKNNYIESVWNIVSNVEDQGLLYKDYKVLPWCTRCGTALSSHELGQPEAYKDIKDISVFVKFKLVDEADTFILAWTTTPWTLPGNVALAVGKDIDYVKIKTKIETQNEFLILAKARLAILTTEYEIVSEMKGSDLVGKAYEPLYPFTEENISDTEKPKLENAYKIYLADFVTTEDGTGVVHTAVMYGADDFELGTKLNLPKHHMVGLDGLFLPNTGFLSGLYVRDEATAVEIIKDLHSRNLLYKKEKHEHSYPHCWRCKTPLLYYARDSWYIAMSKLRDKLVSENQKINWEPAYIKDGRFGEWLNDIKDWAISRERFWATPLPVWECAECKKRIVVKSIADLKSRTKKSGNTYMVMRHGEAEHNPMDLVSCDPTLPNKLTETGVQQVLKTSQNFRHSMPDLVIASPFMRTRETVEIIAKDNGIAAEKIIYDERLGEFNVGADYNGKKWSDYHKDFPATPENFAVQAPGGESRQEVKNRVTELLYELEQKYQNKKILIVTHGAPMWLLFAGASGLDAKDSLDLARSDYSFVGNGEVRELEFAPLPHDENFELDLHRPFIDEVKFDCDCGGDMVRVKEVMDVWFDSGAMPFAQAHYPFEGENILYPADFISEGVDQTRGWFYTMHAIATLMGKGIAYKNVICLGLVMDAEGKKMSKSVGNTVDPWVEMQKYGADTLRLWMYSVNQPGDSKNYDEKVVKELQGKVFTLLENCYKFYELYANETPNLNARESKNPLDKWILTLLDKMIQEGTESLEKYDLFKPTRALRDFVSDFSTWYIRRSRDRFKGEDEEDKNYALATTKHVFTELSKFMAPFTPFFSEEMYLKVSGGKESVHLEDWPTTDEVNAKIIEEMQLVRDLCTVGNALRKKAGIPVRQPLATFFITEDLSDAYKQIIKDELNVKGVEKGPVIIFDERITPELKREGDYRELLRAIQDMRKEKGLTPADVISLTLSNIYKETVSGFEDDLKKTVTASTVAFAEMEEKIKIE